MPDEHDPERERREAAFYRQADPGATMSAERRAFLAGCDYEAGVLEGLLERMAGQKEEEFELLRRVAQVLDSWGGSTDDHARASVVFEQVKTYVKLRDEAAKLEDDGEG